MIRRRIRPPDHLPEATLHHPEVLRACRERDIGKLFRVVQNLSEDSARFTNSHLARRCELTPAQVAEYITDRRVLRSIEVLERIVDALHIPGWYVGLNRRPWEPRPQRPAPSPASPGQAVTDVPSSPDDDEEPAAAEPVTVLTLAGTLKALSALLEWPMRRRRFLAASGVAMIAPAHRWLLDPERLTEVSSGRPVGPEAMDGIDRIVGEQRVLSDQVGIDAALPSLRGTLASVVSLIKNNSYNEVVGARLFAAAAELARLTGWLYYEDGDPDAARHYLVTALGAAQQSGDRALGAYTIARLADVETAFGDPRHAVVLFQAAQAGVGPHLTSRQNADLHAGLARAFGRAGDVDATRRSAGAATDLVSDTGPDDPPYLHWIDAAEVAGSNGRALMDVGATRQARAQLEAAIGRLGASVPRDRAKYHLHLASSMLDDGDVDQACATARHGKDVLQRLGGARLLHHTKAFTAKLAPYRANATAASFLQQTRELAGTTST